LGVISIGLALTNAVAMNMILLLTPKQFGGVVVGGGPGFYFYWNGTRASHKWTIYAKLSDRYY
jgi:hypothetical protein